MSHDIAEEGFQMTSLQDAGRCKQMGVAILISSIVGLIGMSGFSVGPRLGIIGRILALAKK